MKKRVIIGRPVKTLKLGSHGHIMNSDQDLVINAWKLAKLTNNSPVKGKKQ